MKHDIEGKKTYAQEYIMAAHRHTIYNEKEIRASTRFTCFYCGFQCSVHEEQLTWIDETPPKDNTVLCPMCQIDCVIGDASGFPITDEDFILQATEEFFGGISRISDGLPPIEKVQWTEIEVD